MEDSFFEYRDKTGDVSESDSEIIDNSFVENSLSSKKTPVVKNRTLFVAESEESGSEAITDEDEIKENDKVKQNPKLRRSHLAEPHLILSSDDDGSRRGSIRRQSETSSNKVVLSSSDEECQSSAGDVSPELVPRKRLPRTKSKGTPPNSFLRLKSKKRLLRLDSDTEDSIVIEHDKNRKLTCLKDTPLKIDCGKKVIQYSDEDMSNASDDDKVGSDTYTKSDDDHASNVDEASEGDDDGPDEDQMVMSRATRMSIMGFIPKDNDSDESDFIQSEDSKTNSQRGSMSSLNDLPDVSVALYKSPPKVTEPDNDTSRITCSPFSSPLKDITNNDNLKTNSKIDSNLHVIDLDAKENDFSPAKNKVLIDLVTEEIKSKEDDDDITIIDSKPEIIALSSDDEDEVKEEKSPNVKKVSLKVKDENDSEKPKDNTIRQYLMPPSYPNQVVYVQKGVRENELRKLQGLHEDLLNIRNLLDNMDVTTLPDGGVKLIERLTALESSVRLQGDKVANMVVEPDAPTPEDIAKDGFDKGLSWDDIQSASNAVQPRMFGKQAMATHLSERNLILERLRDLHASLDSRPPESAQESGPRALVTDLMPHQLHALAWLRWRETQRPCGGILADDMGLGKTITMISLILSDKENNIENDDDDEKLPKGNGKMVCGGTLVVCPASLMQQWAGEVRKHCRPHCLVVCAHHGATRAQQPHRLAANDVVLTTYNILQRDNEKNGVLLRVAWRRVILDEAHIVRNYKSATSIAVCALRAKRRWALTGTPVHNKDLDLFALMKFLVVTPFDELQMWKKWIDNKSSGGQERLSTIMQCILLRRTKVQLQQRGQLSCLPARSAHQELVTLTPHEMNVYQKVLVFSKTLFAQFLHQRAEKSADAQGFLPPEKDSAYAKMHKKMIALQGAKPVKSHEILVLLLRLRQVCCHCGLIAAMLDGRQDDVEEDPAGQDLLEELNKLSLEENAANTKTGEKEEEEDEPQEQASVAEAIRSVLSPNNPVFQLTRPSSKITAVMDCLKNNVFSKPGEKAVVVSQWTAVLRLVEKELAQLRVRSVVLSGAVPVTARAPLIDALNDGKGDVRVMLLSLCAGGVGLNLCGANHLLLLDPHWNPQLEEQAQDRIYRVGQRRDVHIYRFMCVDTVEQTIRKLQEAKLELADNVLTGARHTNASKLSIEDLKMLFNMGQ